MNKICRAMAAAAMAAVAGCNGYKITQTNHFVDDDGAMVRVDYGRAEWEHVNTFVSPVNGKEMDFRSRLVVEVTLPDGDGFTAWQCMNFNGNGTLYKTDDEEWYFLASGFTCKVAQQDEKHPERYNEIYRGVLCNTPVVTPEKDSRWRKLKTQEKKYTQQ